MAAHKLTRWQKASAIVPMAVLVGAWGAALTNSALATASSDSLNSAVPDVPTNPFDQPASVQTSTTPAGIDSKAGIVNAISSLSTNGIPAASLLAYHRAETLLDKADSSCKLPWPLIAAIGRVESNHGRVGGNSVNADGVSTPGIYGIPLNGSNNTARISDTDNGTYDKDAVWDRAVGPMQFIPGTWKLVGVDSDGDGIKNPQDIDDAATAAGVYLCAGAGNLSTDSGARSAVHRYNRSDEYVDLVLSIAAQYAKGEFTQSQNGYSTSSVLTSRSNDQTLTPSQRAKAKKQESKASKPRSGGSGSTPGGNEAGGESGTTPVDSGGGTVTTPGTGDDGGGSTGGSTEDPVGTVVDGVPGGTTGGTPGTTDPGTTMTEAEATARCIALGQLFNLLQPCVANLLA